MTAATERRALSPFAIAGVQLKNRIVFGAHGTGFGTDGNVNARHIAYQLERARGGVGLIITEATAIDETATGMMPGKSLKNASDAIIPSYRALADTLHAEGVKIFALLSHAGRNTIMSADGLPPKAPSAVSIDRTRDVPHELEIEELPAIVASFASATLRCKQAGLDGASLSFVHGNLVQQFFSPVVNRRSDAYGGSEDNRLRFAREVLQACRQAVGPDFAFGIRFSAAELTPGGYSAEDGVRFAKKFVEWGKLDFIDVSAGDNGSMRSRSYHYPTIAVPSMTLVPLAARLRKELKIPVLTVGKIGDLDEAEQIIRDESADLVVMVRAHIAEPEIIAKTVAGRTDDIRHCIYCNESCFGRQQRVGDITCVYNPRSGRENRWPPLKESSAKKKVVVIGGGPAGLEAARTAARRGNAVTLFEKSDHLGGQIRLLSRTPYRSGYGKIADWLEYQLRKTECEIRLDSNLTADEIVALRADVVVLATGSADERKDIPGSQRDNVVTVREVLQGANLVGNKVVIGDWDARHAGMSVAELLAGRGLDVTIVTSAFYVGSDADLMTWRASYERLLALNVKMLPLHEVREIGQDDCVIEDVSGKATRIPSDSFVFCSRGVADRPLYKQLSGRIPKLHAIGDCWAPRQLEQAIFEGANVGREI